MKGAVATAVFLACAAATFVARADDPGPRPAGAKGDAPAPVRTATPASALAPADRALSGDRLLRADPAPTGSLTAPRGPRFVPGPNAPRLPQISLRGVARNTRKTAALIEVEGQGVFVVRADETFTIAVGSSTATLRVVSIESGSVVLDAPSLSGKVVIR